MKIDLGPIDAYALAKQQGFVGTLDEWLDSLHGKPTEFRKANGYLQWRAQGEDAWNDLLALEEISAVTMEIGNVTTGAPGTPASVVNRGTAKAPVLDITIPRGTDGDPAPAEAIAPAVEAYLDAHPEATTTVEDRSITEVKLADELLSKIDQAGYLYDSKGAKYTMKVVDGEIIVEKVLEAFPGKVRVAEFGPEDVVDIEGGTAYVPQKLYNRVTGEWNALYHPSTSTSIQPFFDNQTKKPTKAREILLTSKTNSFSAIFVVADYAKPLNQDDSFFSGRVRARNSYGKYNWDTVMVDINNIPYINASGETSMFSAGTIELDDIRFSDTAFEAGRWTIGILAFSFNSDGTISVLFCDQELYKVPVPDWSGWDFATLFEESFKCCSMCTNLSVQHLRTVVLLNDAVTLDSLKDYYDFLRNDVHAESIISQDSFYLQPGDTMTLCAEVAPDSAKSGITAAITGLSVAKLDGDTITALTVGETTLTLTTDGVAKTVPIHVGVQTGTEVTSERVVTDIAIVNPIGELQVGDEWALYAVALTDNAVPYSVQEDNIVSMSSSDPDVITAEFGVLRARGVGSATVTVTDHTGTVEKTLEVAVVAADSDLIPERDVYHCNDRTHNIYNDGTHAAETTAGLAAAIAYAEEQGYKKIVFNPGRYLCNADYGTLSIPSGMVVDFQSAEIVLQTGTQSAASYRFIVMDSCEKSVLRNLTVYGEKYTGGTGSTATTALTIRGNSNRCRVENCKFLYSTGFNVGCDYSRTAIVGFQLSNVEAGGIADDGTPDDTNVTGKFRAKNHIDITSIGETFGLGNMQGYQGYLYLSARVYDIYFYDADKTLIGSLENCIQYQQYNKPAGAKYCKIVFYQASAPTSGDPDYASVAHIYTASQPKFTMFKDCEFAYATMTGLSPQGGIATTLDGCTFLNNGSRDPYSHIDWEDGRIHIQGHIVRNCTFKQTESAYRSNLISTAGRDVVLHNCTVQGGTVSIGSESQNWRVYYNDFRETTVSLGSKGDMAFAGNLLAAEPTTSVPVGGAIHLLENTVI